MVKSVLDELKELADARKPKCGARVAFDLLESKVATQLEEALVSGAFSYTVIRDFLKKRDISVSNDALGEHKRGLCRCRITNS